MGLFWARRARAVLPLARVQTSEQIADTAGIIAAGTIGAIRSRAVQAGVETARGQLQTLSLETPAVRAVQGLYPASVTVRRYTSDLRVEIKAAEAEGLSKADAVEQALIKLEGRGAAIAETETSQAWNLGRRKAVKDAVREAKSHGLVVLECWVTEFGPNTCERCEFADGETIRLGDTFSEGVPGAVHPRCKCTSIYLYETPEAAWLLTG